MKGVQIFILILVSESLGEQLTIRNSCAHNIYVKSDGINSGGFELLRGASRSVSIDRGSSARIWAHKRCDKRGENCETMDGDVSQAEMFWDGRGMTWYDVNQVDGYNLPIKMEPVNPKAGGNCDPAVCRFDIHRDCPKQNRVIQSGRGKGGMVVACKNPDKDMVTEYSRNMKRSCPGVYSWSQDYCAGLRACNPGNDGLIITFC